MPIKFYYIRFIRYFKKYGLKQSFNRLWTIVKRRLFQNASIIYYSNLAKLKPSSQNYLNLKIETKKSQDDVTDDNYNRLYEYHDKRILEHQIRNRFDRGAVLWLAKINGEIVGFVWTIKKHTIKPFFFPLTNGDVYLFDNEIFEDYRGKGINSIFLDKVLMELCSEGFIRAFIDTGLWNKPERHSLGKTCFKKLSIVSQVQFFKKNIVIWHKQNNVQEI